ncbi:MAG: hypothetical protein AAGH15_16185 [Myxococcota bacterium]
MTGDELTVSILREIRDEIEDAEIGVIKGRLDVVEQRLAER